MGGRIIKKYFFILFKAFCEKKHVGGGSIVGVCSCSIDRMEEVLLEDYNKDATRKADKVSITSPTILDKKTAEQLSKNFTDGALIIDDGDNAEEEKECVEMSLARDKDGMLCLLAGSKITKQSTYWYCEDGEFLELDCGLFPEVQWSDEEPTRVKLVIEK